MITFAIDARVAEPGPSPSAIGIMPAISVSVVIRIGRRRFLFASMIASCSGIPRSRSVFV